MTTGVFLERIYVDADFLNTMKIKLYDGRFFSNNLNEEKGNAVISKKAAGLLGVGLTAMAKLFLILMMEAKIIM